eukprot:6207973-Pleurochrysis_carterae.AAC.1
MVSGFRQACVITRISRARVLRRAAVAWIVASASCGAGANSAASPDPLFALASFFCSRTVALVLSVPGSASISPVCFGWWRRSTQKQRGSSKNQSEAVGGVDPCVSLFSLKDAVALFHSQLSSKSKNALFGSQLSFAKGRAHERLCVARDIWCVSACMVCACARLRVAGAACVAAAALRHARRRRLW